MKELKFRIWNNVLKMYEEDFHLNQIGELCAWNHAGCDPLEKEDKEYFTIELYSGLKDKNGKEIYEGDIIAGKKAYFNYSHDFTETKVTGLVCYEKNLSGFIVDRCKEIFLLGTYSQNLIKIIGNIHENPELLENNS